MRLPISRRDFLKMTGAAAIGVLAPISIDDAHGDKGSNATADGGKCGVAEAATHRDARGEVKYGERHIPVLLRADVCIVGGGPSGTAAAITAAERGAKVVLIERGIALGGLQTQGLVMPFMPTHAPKSDTPYIVRIRREMLARGIQMCDGVTDFGWSNAEALADVYGDICTDTGVEILYQTSFVDVLMKDRRITHCIVQTIEGLMAIAADVFIDGTGDALLARLAGVPSEKGSDKTGRNQPMSFRFEMGGIDIDKVYHYVAEVLHDDWCKTKPPYFEFAQARGRTMRYKLEGFFQRGVLTGELQKEDAEYIQAFTIPGKPGTMAMNCPEIPPEYSATDAISYSRAVRFGRQMMRRIAAYLVRHMPGFEHAYIAREASMLGARESWRIRGKYYMTEDDYHNRARFTDAVARTAWYIDAHGERVDEKLPEGEFYEITYRALVTNEVKNLIVGGRCISASFVLQASMRIQATCMSIGEAAGIAAAWCSAHRIDCNALAWDTIPESERSYVSNA